MNNKLKILLLAVILLLYSMPFFIAKPANAAPLNILDQAPVYINNTQSSATPNQFQQVVKIPISQFSSYLYDNNTSANFEFYYANNTIIPSWIESVNASTIVVWLKLYSIPANTEVKIYLGFASKTTNLLSSSGTTGIGEAPQLSPTYAEYDDGAKVFNSYWNFAGTTLPSGWSGTGYTVNNGVTVNAPGTEAVTNYIITNSASYNTNEITEFYFPSGFNFGQPNGGTSGIVEGWGLKKASGTNTSNMIEVFNNYGIGGTDFRTVVSGTTTSSGTFKGGPSSFISSMYSTSSGAVFGIGTNAPFYDNSHSATLTSNVYTGLSYIYLWSYDSDTNVGPVDYIRVRALPPNNVMPTVTFGSIITYQISFYQTSLPPGTLWGIRLNSTTKVLWLNTSGEYDNFTNLYAGTYYYQVVNATGYYAPIYEGEITINLANVSQLISFKAGYSISIKKSGLPQGIRWWVNVSKQPGLAIGSVSASSTSSYNNFTEPNGSYSFSISDSEFYFYKPASNDTLQFTVSGYAISLNVYFVKNITYFGPGKYIAYSNATISYYVGSSSQIVHYNTFAYNYTFLSPQNDYQGQYWNSTNIYFNYTLPSNANTSRAASYKVSITNLTILYKSSNYISFYLGSQNFTYYSLTKYKNTYNISAYINVSLSKSVQVKFTTAELINDYPSASYIKVVYAGHGSTEKLIVNTTSAFSDESMQISDINWGDGSPETSSSVEVASNGYYNFSITHQYNAVGTYTVTFLIINAVGYSSSLSVSESTSITLTLTLTTTPNSAPVKTNTYIYFNYTQVNLNLQNVWLYINGILALSQNVSSNTNYLGSVAYDIPYYLTQTATFTALWEYSGGGISGSVNIEYSVANSVPTVGRWVILNYTIVVGSTKTNESIPYFYAQTIPYNATWSYYVWQILLPQNSTDISVRGSPFWIPETISVPADFNKTTATYTLLINANMFQVTWLAPNPVGNALIVIQYYPESAIFGEFGVNIPFNQFNTYLNGKQIYSPTQQVNLGQAVTINTTTAYGVLISSYTTTVTVQTQFIEIPLNIVPLTIENLNSSYVIGFTVTQHNITQEGQYMMPLETQTFYIPAGTYNFSFTYVNFNSYVVVKYLNLSMTIAGVSYFIITGVTLTNIDTHVSQMQNNITNLVENVNITLSNSNTRIYNETLKISASITNTNSSITKQLLDENATINNIYSKVQAIDSAIYAIQNNILSDINQTSLNITTRTTVIKDLVSLSLQEENSTFSYILKFGTPSVSGETYSFPVFVSLFNGQMANLSVTQQAWQNLRLYYISGNETVSLPFSVSDVKPGSFIVSIQNITPSMAQQISSNDAVISAQGEVKEGALVNLAAGIIGSSQITYSSSNLWTEIFGVSPPRLNDSVSGMLHILSWLDESYAGRAIYLIVILAALAYYTIMIQNSFDRRKKK